jgi:hypothetical protein
MRSYDLAYREIKRHRWADYSCDGVSCDQLRIPNYLLRLIISKTEQEAENAYWRLDNNVVTQGCSEEGAIPVIPVIYAALAGDDYSQIAEGWLVELLHQIICYHAINETVEQRCLEEGRKGLWLLCDRLTHLEERLRKSLGEPTVENKFELVRQTFEEEYQRMIGTLDIGNPILPAGYHVP